MHIDPYIPLQGPYFGFRSCGADLLCTHRILAEAAHKEGDLPFDVAAFMKLWPAQDSVGWSRVEKPGAARWIYKKMLRLSNVR